MGRQVIPQQRADKPGEEDGVADSTGTHLRNLAPHTAGDHDEPCSAAALAGDQAQVAGGEEAADAVSEAVFCEYCGDGPRCVVCGRGMDKEETVPAGVAT